MDHLLVLLVLLWSSDSSGLQTEGQHSSTDFLRLVGGDSRCAGTLEVKHEGEWRPVFDADRVTLRKFASVCRKLDCGSAVSVGETEESSVMKMWSINNECDMIKHPEEKCFTSLPSITSLYLTCSDSVRLVNGTSLCSGRLEVRSDQSDQSNQSWSSVCEAAFDQQDAEVVCRELGCEAPSVLQGALYGEGEAPMWTKEFQCGGDESSLLDCRSSGSDRNTCSPGRAVGLTCSEPHGFRLEDGHSRCAGRLLLQHQGEWRPVTSYGWTLQEVAVVCRELDCGSAVSLGYRRESLSRDAWWISPYCVQSRSAVRECVEAQKTYNRLYLTCSDSVRLVNGTSLCSGRLEVKSAQSNQSWSSVCEAAFDQQDAEVVCRELGCGAPSVLQGALYGEGEAPMWTKEFQCGGDESSLLDCRSSGSDRNTCSPGRAVGLTCSEYNHVRLVGGDNRCGGKLEVKQWEDWLPVKLNDWTLKDAAIVCKQLDCGSAVFVRRKKETSAKLSWEIKSDCVQTRHALQKCAERRTDSSSFIVLNCSDSVRLVNGTSLCSGRLEVKSDQSWSSVCEAAFDQQDAEVVCRELGCEAPSVLQGALYGEGEAPMWTKEFQCGGDESSLLDCRSSGSDRNTCSPGRAVGLTCSEPVRLVGGDSRCAGTLEVKYQGEWRPADDSDWTLKEAAVVCRELDCGSAVSVGRRNESLGIFIWWIQSNCVGSGLAVRECALPWFSLKSLNLTCSNLLHQPNISASSSMDEHVDQQQQEEFQVFKGSNFTISCSIQPQYPGGSFQLTFTSSNSTINYTQPAVNHSADFLFPAAEPAHQGSYSCVYHAHVFSHNFSSESQPLSVHVLDPAPFIIRAVLLPLTFLLLNAALYFYRKATRGQKPSRQENTEMDYYNLGVPAAEGGPAEEEAAQGDE